MEIISMFRSYRPNGVSTRYRIVYGYHMRFDSMKTYWIEEYLPNTRKWVPVFTYHTWVYYKDLWYSSEIHQLLKYED